MSLNQHLYTIGHSNHDLDYFLSLLKKQSIELLVDVRSAPYSKHAPHFNKQNQKNSLESNFIDYFYLGNQIGGRPSNKSYYDGEKVLYSLFEKDKKYLDGINILIRLIKKKKTVIMCTEENPLKCHRHMLITQTLLKKGFSIYHIRGNGEIQEVEEKTVQSTLF